MQTTVYYSEADAYLLQMVDKKARYERKSRSAVILEILEHHFESNKRLGEILVDLGLVSGPAIREALSLQESGQSMQRLGDILVERHVVGQEGIERAVLIQQRVE